MNTTYRELVIKTDSQCSFDRVCRMLESIGYTKRKIGFKIREDSPYIVTTTEGNFYSCHLPAAKILVGKTDDFIRC